MRLSGLGYGTAKDDPDPRDYWYDPPTRRNAARPAKVDLRALMPPVYNQRHLNSCSANAIGAALWFEERHHHRNPRHPSPSRLFIYFNERAVEGVIAHNDPVSLRSGYKTVARNGVCPEHLWPYDVRRFRRCPPRNCYGAAEDHKAIRYARVRRSLWQMQACLASQQPFTVGLAVYESFKSTLAKRAGLVPQPARRHEKCLGGHAMLVVGYLEDSRHFIVRNSWGSSWGDRGYCYIPYSYLLKPDLAWDIWTIGKVT